MAQRHPQDRLAAVAGLREVSRYRAQQHSHWNRRTRKRPLHPVRRQVDLRDLGDRLNTLKWCRVSSDQNAITVSIGGQPGTAQNLVHQIAPSPSENRARTPLPHPARAAECSGAGLQMPHDDQFVVPGLCRASTSY